MCDQRCDAMSVGLCVCRVCVCAVPAIAPPACRVLASEGRIDPGIIGCAAYAPPDGVTASVVRERVSGSVGEYRFYCEFVSHPRRAAAPGARAAARIALFVRSICFSDRMHVGSRAARQDRTHTPRAHTDSDTHSPDDRPSDTESNKQHRPLRVSDFPASM